MSKQASKTSEWRSTLMSWCRKSNCYDNKVGLKTYSDASYPQTYKALHLSGCSPYDARGGRFLQSGGRLLLVVPASSVEAVRSFTALRRLKTWLRSSMSQMCEYVCHVHLEKLDRPDLEGINRSFIGVNDKCKKAFGSNTQVKTDVTAWRGDGWGAEQKIKWITVSLLFIFRIAIL